MFSRLTRSKADKELHSTAQFSSAKKVEGLSDGLTQQLICKRKYPGISHLHRTLGSNKQTVLEHENLSAPNSVIYRLSVMNAHHTLAIYYKYQQNTELTISVLFEKTSL